MWHWSGNGSAPDHAATSVIDQGCDLEGRLTFVGTLVMNGKLHGEVVSSDTLIVGDTGDLDADIHVGVAIVSGTIRGHMTARDRVELRKSASMFGDIETPVLVMEEGVVFDGHCKMKGNELEVVKKRS